MNQSTETLLILLCLVWAVLLFGGFFFGTENKEGTRRMPTWTRMASSVTLVIAAWVWWWYYTREPGTLAFYTAVGMTLGCIGDFFMAGLIPVKQNVLGGMVSFGLGHIAYSIGLLGIVTYPNYYPRFILVAVWLIVAVVLWYLVVFRGSTKTTLHYAALPYSLLLATTAGLATMRTLQSEGFIPITVGAALFLLSDLILATRLFNNARFRLIDDVVWLLYGPGQMLIVTGFFWYIILIIRN